MRWKSTGGWLLLLLAIFMLDATSNILEAKIVSECDFILTAVLNINFRRRVLVRGLGFHRLLVLEALIGLVLGQSELLLHIVQGLLFATDPRRADLAMGSSLMKLAMSVVGRFCLLISTTINKHLIAVGCKHGLDIISVVCDVERHVHAHNLLQVHVVFKRQLVQLLLLIFRSQSRDLFHYFLGRWSLLR
mmetsp:Transcript_8443/g.12882  ORF Transcript_8443/g.12882 Transcript_8443/m.12882 type:complete len:190 (+) Transcript_8443:3066-3635(+)